MRGASNVNVNVKSSKANQAFLCAPMGVFYVICNLMGAWVMGLSEVIAVEAAKVSS